MALNDSIFLDPDISLGHRIALGTALFVLFGLIVLLIVGIPLLAIRENEIAARDQQMCESRGLEMTSIIQGYGKSRHARHLCVGKDGTLYAL